MRENAEQAALLVGTADSLRESIGYEIELTERLFRNDYLAKVRAALDEKTLDALNAQGRAINLEAALALITKPGLLEGDAKEALFSTETISEVVIEKRSFTRIIIEEENL